MTGGSAALVWTILAVVIGGVWKATAEDNSSAVYWSEIYYHLYGRGTDMPW